MRMNFINIHHALFFFSCCCCLSAQRLGNKAGATVIFTKTEGEDFRDSFTVGGAEHSGKYLCRNDCNRDDVLIETYGARAQSGRYTIRYDGGLYVVISELRLSDAGQYRFGTNASSSPNSFRDVYVRVREMCDGGVTSGGARSYSTTEGGDVTIQCSVPGAPRNRKFLCRDKCETVVIGTSDTVARSGRYSIKYGNNTLFNVTIGQLTESDAGRYRCGVGRQTSPNICQEFEITVTMVPRVDAVAAVVSMTVIVLLVLSILLVYKWKGRHFNCVNGTRTSPTTNTERDLYEDPTLVLSEEEPCYENVSPAYETLNQYTTTPDQIYFTLEH